MGFYSIWPFGSWMFNTFARFFRVRQEQLWGKKYSPGLRQLSVQIPSLPLMSWVSLDKKVISLVLIISYVKCTYFIEIFMRKFKIIYLRLIYATQWRGMELAIPNYASVGYWLFSRNKRLQKNLWPSPNSLKKFKKRT